MAQNINNNSSTNTNNVVRHSSTVDKQFQLTAELARNLPVWINDFKVCDPFITRENLGAQYEEVLASYNKHLELLVRIHIGKEPASKLKLAEVNYTKVKSDVGTRYKVLFYTLMMGDFTNRQRMAKEALYYCFSLTHHPQAKYVRGDDNQMYFQFSVTNITYTELEAFMKLNGHLFDTSPIVEQNPEPKISRNEQKATRNIPQVSLKKKS